MVSQFSSLGKCVWVSFCEWYTPGDRPFMESAFFETSGTSILVVFNTDTDRGTLGSEYFSCSQIFTRQQLRYLSGSNGDDPECIWIDFRRLRVILKPGFLLRPMEKEVGEQVYNSITISIESTRIRRLKETCSVYDTICQNEPGFGEAVIGRVGVNGVDSYNPTVKLEGPSRIGRCEDWVYISAQATEGCIGHSCKYTWSLKPPIVLPHWHHGWEYDITDAGEVANAVKLVIDDQVEIARLEELHKQPDPLGFGGRGKKDGDEVPPVCTAAGGVDQKVCDDRIAAKRCVAASGFDHDGCDHDTEEACGLDDDDGYASCDAKPGSQGQGVCDVHKTECAAAEGVEQTVCDDRLAAARTFTEQVCTHFKEPHWMRINPLDSEDINLVEDS